MFTALSQHDRKPLGDARHPGPLRSCQIPMCAQFKGPEKTNKGGMLLATLPSLIGRRLPLSTTTRTAVALHNRLSAPLPEQVRHRRDGGHLKEWSCEEAYLFPVLAAAFTPSHLLLSYMCNQFNPKI